MIPKSEAKGGEDQVKTRQKLQAVALSIGTAFFLTIFKLSVGFITHSLGLIASAVDSLMDVFVSSVNLISLREAEKPADGRLRGARG